MILTAGALLMESAGQAGTRHGYGTDLYEAGDDLQQCLPRRRLLCVVELGNRIPARMVAAGGLCGDACTVRGECPEVFTPVPRGGFVVDEPSCRERLQRVGDCWLFDVHF